MKRDSGRGETLRAQQSGRRECGRRDRLGDVSLRVLLTVALGALALSFPALDNAVAETARKPGKTAPAKPAKSDDEGGADAALRAYDGGVKSWQAGKADGAVEQLNAAIATSKLPPQQMARALYYRGLAQRKLGKPAMAISDLQSALWLKGALTESERSEALAARTAAYREAGIADPTSGKVAESSAAISTATTPKVSAAQPMRAAEAKPAAVPAPIQTSPVRDTYAPIGQRAEALPSKAAAATPSDDWKTNVRGAARPAAAPSSTASVAVAPAPAAMPVRAVAAPPPATTEGLQGSAYSPGPAARQVAAVAAPAPVPPPAPALASQQVTAPAGGLFSNLFGGITTGSTAPPLPELPERRRPPIGLQEDPDAGKPPIGGTEPWGDARVRSAPRGAKVASAAGVTAGIASGASGTFRLQVAAAKSKQDAEKIAAQIKREQPKAVAQRTLEVDQVGGDNAQASVWRVRLGPFASANEPRNICVKLRQSGYDCMVVSQ